MADMVDENAFLSILTWKFKITDLTNELSTYGLYYLVMVQITMKIL